MTRWLVAGVCRPVSCSRLTLAAVRAAESGVPARCPSRSPPSALQSQHGCGNCVALRKWYPAPAACARGTFAASGAICDMTSYPCCKDKAAGAKAALAQRGGVARGRSMTRTIQLLRSCCGWCALDVARQVHASEAGQSRHARTAPDAAHAHRRIRRHPPPHTAPYVRRGRGCALCAALPLGPQAFEPGITKELECKRKGEDDRKNGR